MNSHFLKKSFRVFSCFCLLSVFLSLAGCSTPTPAPTAMPTVDPATYIAAAVETLSAQMTEEALRNPTATPVPPTNTPVPPTNTPEPPAATATPAIPPTATATQAPALSAQFLYAATYPENKRIYVPNEEFGLALGFQNTGTITWSPGTILKIINFKGEITVQQKVEIESVVEPGDKVEFNLWAYGSETLGEHTWVFQIYNREGGAISGGVGYFSYTSK